MLSGWLMCFMRVCFQSVQCTGLLHRENTLFIVLCAGVLLGMLAPLPDWRLHGKKIRMIQRVSVLLAIPCMILSLYAQAGIALLFVFCASLSASVAMGCSLYGIAMELAPGSFGLLFGMAFAVSEGLLLVLLFMPPGAVSAPVPAHVAGLCVLLLAVAITGMAIKEPAFGDGSDKAPGSPPVKVALRKYLTALLLYCVMGGMLDNLTAFDDAFLGIPNMLQIIYLYSVAANLILAAFFHRLKWPKLAMAGVLLICVGQALPYFFSVSVLAVPYLVFTMTGVIIMEFLVRCLPARYAAGMSREALCARLGYASLYGGFLVSSILFEFIPRGWYFFVMGLALLLSFAILSLLQSASGDEETELRVQLIRKLRDISEAAPKEAEQPTVSHPLLTAEEITFALLLIEGRTRSEIAHKLHMSAVDASNRMESIRDKISGGIDPDPAISIVVKEYKLTGRETHMLRCLRNGMTNPQIAEELILSETTVKKHIQNLMKKLPIEGRQHISAWLSSIVNGSD
jgi:DNA-binding NarL/FixJ family response regulator